MFASLYELAAKISSLKLKFMYQPESLARE